MLITILILGVVVTFLLEYFDDIKQRKRFNEAAKLTISEARSKIEHFDFDNNSSSIEGLLTDIIIRNLSFNKGSDVKKEKKGWGKLKVRVFSESMINDLEHKLKPLKNNDYYFLKQRRTYFLYYTIINMMEQQVVIEFTKNKQPLIFRSY